MRWKKNEAAVSTWFDHVRNNM